MVVQPAFTRTDPDLRRQSLIEAAARVLATKGAAGISVRTICAEAGVSAGLLRHYFASLSEAIAETYRWTGATIDRALDEAVAAVDPNPRAQLIAYLAANFRPPIATPALLAAYVAFWSLTLTDPAVAVVRVEIYESYRAGLEKHLAAYRPNIGETRLIAVALTALIDGLWLELSLGKAPFSAEEAETLAAQWLDALVPHAVDDFPVNS